MAHAKQIDTRQVSDLHYTHESSTLCTYHTVHAHTACIELHTCTHYTRRHGCTTHIHTSLLHIYIIHCRLHAHYVHTCCIHVTATHIPAHTTHVIHIHVSTQTSHSSAHFRVFMEVVVQMSADPICCSLWVPQELSTAEVDHHVFSLIWLLGIPGLPMN